MLNRSNLIAIVPGGNHPIIGPNSGNFKKSIFYFSQKRLNKNLPIIKTNSSHLGRQIEAIRHGAHLQIQSVLGQNVANKVSQQKSRIAIETY
jgi:hypothetical protein